MNLSHAKIIESLGGITAVATRLGIRPPSVSGWIFGGKNGIPEGRLIQLGAEIEKATSGSVTRKDLRPADWMDIWPELSNEVPAPDLVGEAVAAIQHEAGEAIAEIKHVAEAIAPKDVPWDGVCERRMATEPRRAVDRQAPWGTAGQGAGQGVA